jgi:predicted mannosyl-3-phosphoglycerate phosphatase (HAD superfamily)
MVLLDELVVRAYRFVVRECLDTVEDLFDFAICLADFRDAEIQEIAEHIGMSHLQVDFARASERLRSLIDRAIDLSESVMGKCFEECSGVCEREVERWLLADCIDDCARSCLEEALLEELL